MEKVSQCKGAIFMHIVLIVDHLFGLLGNRDGQTSWRASGLERERERKRHSQGFINIMKN